MTYEEYIQKRRAGKIIAGIDNSIALKLIRYLPKGSQAAHFFWTWVSILSIPAFICVAVFWKWWVGLLLLFIGSPMLLRATKRSAAEFVLEQAEENKEFFEKLVEKDLLMFKEST